MGVAQIAPHLASGIEAHGGHAQWDGFALLTYELVRGESSEHHTIDLRTRRTVQKAENHAMGYDGEAVWVSPDADAFSGNPHFYNGLYFYFFAMPFVLGDPGVISEALGQRRIDGVSYDVVGISYEADVGASPNDTYLAHFDPATGQLRMLLYTVTFNDGEPNTNYNVIRYDVWQEVSGLTVPAEVTFHRWNKETQTLGEKRGEATFTNVQFEPTMDASIFERPANSVIIPNPDS